VQALRSSPSTAKTNKQLHGCTVALERNAISYRRFMKRDASWQQEKSFPSLQFDQMLPGLMVRIFLPSGKFTLKIILIKIIFINVFI
jgi:hypothetical protein